MMRRERSCLSGRVRWGDLVSDSSTLPSDLVEIYTRFRDKISPVKAYQ